MSETNKNAMNEEEVTAQEAAAEEKPAKAAKKAAAKAAPAKEKTVKIRLPKTRENQDDVFVSVNNRTWLIKRGVEVEVPECVAEVFRNQERMMEETFAFEVANQK